MTAIQVGRMHAPDHSARNLALLKLLVGALAIGPLVLGSSADSGLPATTQLLGGLTWFLAVLPFYSFLTRRHTIRRPLPFLETVSLLYGLYYALPIALGQVNRAWDIWVDPSTGYDVPMQLAFLGWVAMMAAYGLSSELLRQRRPPQGFPWNPQSVAKWGSAFLVSGVAVNGMRPILPTFVFETFGGFLQLFVSLQWLGLGLLIVLSRRGELSGPGRALLVGGFVAAVIVAFAQGSVSPVFLLYVVGGFALWAGRPRIEPRWIVAGIAGFLIAIAVRGVMSDFRRVTWNVPQLPPFSQRVQLMRSLLSDRLENEGMLSTLSGGGRTVAQRSATMDLFADVIRRTPSEVPYWGGATYYSLVGVLIPRFLWKNKPTKELGQAFGHRYRYLHHTNKKTSINLPVLVEFYANFGAFAVVLGMFLVGAIYAILDSIVNRPGQSVMLSMVGLTLLLPLLSIESDFSLTFGGLPLSGLVLWGILVAMRGIDNKIKARTSRPAGGARYDPGQLGGGGQTRPAFPVR
jgi:hypothetical protein